MFSLMCLRRLHTTACTLSSALYVTGQKASETFAFLTPHLDCDAKFQDITKLKKNVEARGMDINVDGLKDLWDFLKAVKDSKRQLEVRREETTKKIKALMHEKSQDDPAIKPLKILGKMIREKLKVITKEIWDLEETVILQVLALPNDLHSDTPIDSEHVISVEGPKSNVDHCISHIEIGQQLGLIKYLNPTCYYLEKTAAEFEIAITQFITSHLSEQHFIMSSNSDFTKSLVVEGCGKNHKDINSVFILQSTDESFNEDACLHLTGGASITSFAALFTKHETHLRNNCIKLLSIGRQYSPPPTTNLPTLLSVAQATSAEIFIVGPNCDTQALEDFHQAVDAVTSVYKCMGWHFRVVKCSARQLQPWESMKVSVQMFSQHLQSYVEVGCVSYCDTFISKRLQMKYQDVNGHKDFLNIITGKVMNVPRVLACLVEDKSGLELPDKLHTFIYCK